MTTTLKLGLITAWGCELGGLVSVKFTNEHGGFVAGEIRLSPEQWQSIITLAAERDAEVIVLRRALVAANLRLRSAGCAEIEVPNVE